MRLSLRVRLLAIVLVGIIVPTVVNIAAGGWTMASVRERAAADSSAALERTVGVYLSQLAQDRASASGQTFSAANQMARMVADALAKPTVVWPTIDGAWEVDAAGRKVTQGATTILLPAGAEHPSDAVLAESMVDMLFPGVVRALPEVSRISYLSQSGALRSYPRLDTDSLPTQWKPTDDPTYLAAAPARNPQRSTIWTSPHLAMGGEQQVIGVAAPVYRDGIFHGVVVVEISLAQLTVYLDRLSVEESGFTFVLDSNGGVVAASQGAQRTLFGRPLDRAEIGLIPLGLEERRGLESAIASMVMGRRGVTRATIAGDAYTVAYAPIPAQSWSIALAAPQDEVDDVAQVMRDEIGVMAEDAGRTSIAIALGAVLVFGTLLGLLLQRWLVGPLATLSSATRAVAGGDMRHVPEMAGELGELARSFNTMTDALQLSRAEILAANGRLEETVRVRTAELEQLVARLEESSRQQQELLRALRDVSTPVIPVVEGVLVMPLIGQLDDARMQAAMSALLTRVERDRARTVLVDVTGVPMIDTAVAQGLVRSVDACRLLGAEVVLVGIAPEVAQTLVSLGVDLQGMRTSADLRSGVEGLLAKAKVRS